MACESTRKYVTCENFLNFTFQIKDAEHHLLFDVKHHLRHQELFHAMPFSHFVCEDPKNRIPAYRSFEFRFATLFWKKMLKSVSSLDLYRSFSDFLSRSCVMLNLLRLRFLSSCVCWPEKKKPTQTFSFSIFQHLDLMNVESNTPIPDSHFSCCMDCLKTDSLIFFLSAFSVGKPFLTELSVKVGEEEFSFPLFLNHFHEGAKKLLDHVSAAGNFFFSVFNSL